MQALIADERDAFYDTELGQRDRWPCPLAGWRRWWSATRTKTASTPSAGSWSSASRVSRRADGVRVLGPAAAPIAVVGVAPAAVPRARCTGGAAATLPRPLAGGSENAGALRMQVDIDPYSFL